LRASAWVNGGNGDLAALAVSFYSGPGCTHFLASAGTPYATAKTTSPTSNARTTKPTTSARIRPDYTRRGA